MALIYIVEDDKNIQEIEMFALKNIDYAVEGLNVPEIFTKGCTRNFRTLCC